MEVDVENIIHQHKQLMDSVKHFSMTNKVRRVDPYWYVDLGGIYTIRHIDIFNRRKSSGGYFSQFILVSVLTAINISVMKTALNTI